MRRLRNLPGSAVALGAFVLTVLLGTGGPAASALWQQTATATMTVTASATWPGPFFTGFTCTNDSNRTNATLTATGPKAPTSMAYAALQPNGTFGPSYFDAAILGSTGTVVLNVTSPIITANRQTAQLTVRVTATYPDQTQAIGTAVVQIEQGNNSNKVTCISASA
jgi:hypothetical protein